MPHPNPLSNSAREVVCADAVEWLRTRPPIAGASFFASLPDYSEFPGRTLEEWKSWFRETAGLILSRTPDDGVALFFQSDIKVDGVWVDKAFLCQQAAEDLGHALLFHKIFCRAPVGTPTFGRPGYSHLLGFSRGLRGAVARSTADVVEEVGEKTWVRGTGFRAASTACRFVAEETPTRLLVNPFCGEGALLAVANSHGLRAIGIERSPKRAEKARGLEVAEDGRGWKDTARVSNSVAVLCPLCRADHGRVIAALPLDGFSTPRCRYFRCGTCDLTFLDPFLRLAASEEKARYELHENRLDDPDYRSFLEPAVDAIRRRLPPGASGIDFGAGPGPAAAAMLRESGYSVSLYDPYFHPDSSAIEGQYDFVLTTEVAEHFRDPAAEFVRLRNLLRPNGILVVMTTMLTPEIDFARWHYRRDPTHLVFYSPQTVEWIARAFQWVVDEVKLPRLFILRAPESQIT